MGWSCVRSRLIEVREQVAVKLCWHVAVVGQRRTGVNRAVPVTDPNRPEDVLKLDADEDGNGGDDAADALRYLVATKAREVRVRKLRGL
jgi:hypothetical protein